MIFSRNIFVSKFGANMKNVLLFFIILSIFPMGLFGRDVFPRCDAQFNDPEFRKELRQLYEDLEAYRFFGEDDMVEYTNKLIEGKMSEHSRYPAGRRIDALKLWRRTEGFRSRDPLYLLPQRKLSCDKPGFSFNFFFNRSSSLPARPNLILKTDAINALLSFIDGVPMTDDQEQDTGALMKILPYLDDMTIQEHRVGGFFQFLFNYKRFVLHADVPVFLAEKNFWIKDRKLRQDLLELLKDTDGGSGGAVRTRFGLGDIRLRLGYKFKDSDRIKAVAGIEGILPTSRWGSKNRHNIIKTEVGSTRQQLLEDLLNVNKYLMIDPKLGTGHWGVGGFFDFRISAIPDKLDIWTRFSYSHLLSRRDDRFMPTLLQMPIAELGALFASETVPDDVNLDPLFPHIVSGKVKPGDIINVTLGFDWKFAKNWKFGIGYDYYRQQRERVSQIVAPTIYDNFLSIEEGIASKVIQHKAFCDFAYTKKGRKRDWRFAFGGDTTFSSEGAARDWTLFAKIGISF